MRNFFGLARVWVRVRVRPVRVRVRPIRIRVRPIRVRVRPIRIRARPIRVRVKSRVRRPQDLFPREGRIGPGSGDPLLGIHSLCSGGRGSRVVPPELEALFFHPGFCPVINYYYLSTRSFVSFDTQRSHSVLAQQNHGYMSA